MSEIVIRNAGDAKMFFLGYQAGRTGEVTDTGMHREQPTFRSVAEMKVWRKAVMLGKAEALRAAAFEYENTGTSLPKKK